MKSAQKSFRVRPIYRVKKPRFSDVLRQKLSFIIASFSLMAFVVGNMVGQHGWYYFWRSVLGKEDVSTMVFVGFVPPITKVPDYSRWKEYGGGELDHTYRQVPQDLLVPLPAYDSTLLKNRSNVSETLLEYVYSVGNLGDYATGSDHGGSHVGVDIRVPIGTPVVSIGNGIVETAVNQSYGYGHYVVIRHPNVPDPENPSKTTTVYSVYAHLDVLLVSAGQTVRKGEQIATSGDTGFASGPHLHFQIDKESAPFHPYWPFTSSQASEKRLTLQQAVNAGLHQSNGDLYTYSPLLLVQAYQGDVPVLRIASQDGPKISPVERRTQRISTRVPKVLPPVAMQTFSSVSSGTPSLLPQISTTTVAQVEPIIETPRGGSSTDVDRLRFVVPSALTHGWQTIRLEALSRDGTLVSSPSFSGRVYLTTEFGEASMRPEYLEAKDFANGSATIQFLARGTKTVILATRGTFTTVSAPMVYQR